MLGKKLLLVLIVVSLSLGGVVERSTLQDENPYPTENPTLDDETITQGPNEEHVAEDDASDKNTENIIKGSDHKENDEEKGSPVENTTILEENLKQSHVSKEVEAAQPASPNIITLVPAAIGIECKITNCSSILNSVCKEGICECEDNFIPNENGTKCLRRVKTRGDACEIDKQCENLNLKCINNVCHDLSTLVQTPLSVSVAAAGKDKAYADETRGSASSIHCGLTLIITIFIIKI